MKGVFVFMNRDIRDALEWYTCLLVRGEESEISDFYETLEGMCDGNYIEELYEIREAANNFLSKKETLVHKFEEGLK